MPSTYSMESLPKPNSDKVTIKEIAEKEFIVIRFSGLHSATNLADQEKLLLKHVAEKQIKTVGLPKYAFYNPPWTLPFLRRNEVMIEIDSQK